MTNPNPVITALETLNKNLDGLEKTLAQFQASKQGQQSDLFRDVERARDQNQALKKELDSVITQLEGVLTDA
jgi:seryl-tRNA synthetase